MQISVSQPSRRPGSHCTADDPDKVLGPLDVPEADFGIYPQISLAKKPFVKIRRFLSFSVADFSIAKATLVSSWSPLHRNE